MTRYLAEAFQVHDAVKKTGKIFQVGSQGCSAIGWHKAAEMIQAGKIGELIWAQGYYCRNSGPSSTGTKGEWNYPIDKTSTPENIDWNAWLGPVSKRPFSADAFHRWRKYFPYCSGLLGDLVPHRMHPLMLATGNPQFPVRVTSIGTKPVHSDKYTPGTPERDVAEHVQILAEFPGGSLITVTCSSVNSKSPGFVIYGHHATLEIGNLGDKLKLVPEKEWSEEIDGVELTELVPTEDPRNHEKNWFECIRSGKQPNAGIDLAIRVQTVISLAEMSDRLKVTCLFDEKSRKITTENGRELKPITYGTLPLS
jgi:predicted dehydrogenase